MGAFTQPGAIWVLSPIYLPAESHAVSIDWVIAYWYSFHLEEERLKSSSASRWVWDNRGSIQVAEASPGYYFQVLTVLRPSVSSPRLGKPVLHHKVVQVVRQTPNACDSRRMSVSISITPQTSRSKSRKEHPSRPPLSLAHDQCGPMHNVWPSLTDAIVVSSPPLCRHSVNTGEEAADDSHVLLLLSASAVCGQLGGAPSQ